MELSTCTFQCCLAEMACTIELIVINIKQTAIKITMILIVQTV